MLNYKECDIKDFEKAMELKNTDIKTISTEHLYILYTKFKADAYTCYYQGGSYANNIGDRSNKKAEAYKIELNNRGIEI